MKSAQLQQKKMLNTAGGRYIVMTRLHECFSALVSSLYPLYKMFISLFYHMKPTFYTLRYYSLHNVTQINNVYS